MDAAWNTQPAASASAATAAEAAPPAGRRLPTPTLPTHPPLSQVSYTYWTAGAAREAPPPQPVLLSEAEARAQAEREAQLGAAGGGGSAWNAAGTFEERPVSLDWVRAQLEELLGGICHIHSGDGGACTVTVIGVGACGGEAHQWVVRGKRRAGFDLTGLTFRWRAELDASSSNSQPLVLVGSAT